MRLTSLNPNWVSEGNGRSGQGIRFTCPVHGEPCRLVAKFANPIDGGPPMALGVPGDSFRWQRTGETHDTLTLVPSIHVLELEQWDRNNPEDRSKWVTKTHWHGFITNGEVT